MKKLFLILALIATPIFAKPWYVAVLFGCVQKQLLKVATDLKAAEKVTPIDEYSVNSLINDKDALTVAQIIANGDISALASMPVEKLVYSDGKICAKGIKLPDFLQMKSRLADCMIGGENALAFVVLHAMTDKTQEDKDTTIAMLKILISKRLNPNIKIGVAFLVKDQSTDEYVPDYLGLFSLEEMAACCYPELRQLIDEYIKNFKK